MHAISRLRPLGFGKTLSSHHLRNNYPALAICIAGRQDLLKKQRCAELAQAFANPWDCIIISFAAIAQTLRSFCKEQPQETVAAEVPFYQNGRTISRIHLSEGGSVFPVAIACAH